MVHKAIKIENLNFSFYDQPVLEDINLEIRKKDFLAIIGPNGGGKTTLLKLILGFLKPQKGSIRIFGNPPLKARHFFGYVPQFSSFDDEFPIKVKDVIMSSTIKPFSILPYYKKEVKRKAFQILEKLEIEESANTLIGELSGGQKQRVLIARAIMSNPKILILDEPTASVDQNMEKDIFELLKKLNKDITIIIVSHDIAFISTYVNRVSCLNRCMDTHLISQISKENLFDLYNGKMKMVEHSCGI